MAESAKSTRTWQEIAEEAFRERDSKKLQKLTEELERTLDMRKKERRPNDESKGEGAA